MARNKGELRKSVRLGRLKMGFFCVWLDNTELKMERELDALDRRVREMKRAEAAK